MIRTRNLGSSQDSNLRNTTRVITKRFRSTQTGYSFKPSPEPSLWYPAPWFQLTLVTNLEVPWQVRANDVRDLILKSLGWDGFRNSKGRPLPIVFRVLSVRLYGMASQPIKLVVRELLSGNHATKELSDIGGKSTFSSVGWRWGIQSRIDIIAPNDRSIHNPLMRLPIAECFGGSQTAKTLFYLQVLFKTAKAPLVKYSPVRKGVIRIEDEKLHVTHA